MTFPEFNLTSPILNAVSELGYESPTTIQRKSFSPIMAGENILAIAQTGTGKTAAYLLPLLRLWKFTKEPHPQFVVVVPTRELVVQVEEEARSLAKYMNIRIAGVYGGASMNTQKDMVSKGVDLLIATPGRLVDLVLSGALKLKSAKKLVIDEMDEMLNLGFRPQLIRVLELMPEKRQHLLFSATITEEVDSFIQEHFQHLSRIEAAPSGTPLEKIIQKGYRVPNFQTKINLLVHLLNIHPEMSKVLVFASTKKWADKIQQELESYYSSDMKVIHSNKAQNTRFSAVSDFERGNIRMLIATDIIARGLDITDVTHVINFDLPEIPENYIHRIGRTGRADKHGTAISFINNEEALEAIESMMGKHIPIEGLPKDLIISDVLLEEEKPKVNMKTIHVKHSISGPNFHEKKDKNKKVNMHLTRAEKMQLKYGKPKTKGRKK
jgi:ATP-dependent RNA helicase RhlE